MFNARERVIGAAYVMHENLSEVILTEIKILRPTYGNASLNEVAVSAILDQEHLTANAKRERIIGAAMVMCDDDARKIWSKIMEYVNIPESTPEEAALDLEESLKNDSSQTE